MANTPDGMARPKKPEKSEPLRLPASVVKRIKRLAAHRGADPGDYVADRLGPLLDKDEEKMLREIAEERKGSAG